ncbi:exo-beta-N-acetylmuramidase NamZ family protein [Terrilactibacillus laevilacticus]|uniref:Exo-beta-N-acetylmuramidase NamZ domain-containing protein n=1 Tax=Terrilactibacillus laevilacticus TaxID=1380157 RepID=A0ABW5PMB5_9BACI|nr:DUF1343 domain-containing protein [Terrilactibacillus laevilacticus]
MIKLGIEVLLADYMSLLKGKRIGLVTNMTGVNSNLQSTIDLMYQHQDFQLTTLFGPEHGIRGDVQEGSKIDSSIDPYTKCPVYSLYGNTKKPTKGMLENVDSIIVDLQDIGARYYTFISTLALLMEACMEEKKEVIVLDRPNPINGTSFEGNIIEEPYRSFVGLYPLPNRHGLTIGEIANIYKYVYDLNCELTIIPMKGWDRSMFFSDTGLHWVQPSPNSTGEDMSILYPGMCLIEGTNLSEGRGTTRPFEIVGAPFINGYEVAKIFNSLNLSGVIARPTTFIPNYQKYKGQLCYGIQIHIINKRNVNSFEVGIRLLSIIAQLYEEEFTFLDKESDRCFFNLLSGTGQLKHLILLNQFNDFLDQCKRDCEIFNKKAKPYLLYQ